MGSRTANTRRPTQCPCGARGASRTANTRCLTQCPCGARTPPPTCSATETFPSPLRGAPFKWRIWEKSRPWGWHPAGRPTSKVAATSRTDPLAGLKARFLDARRRAPSLLLQVSHLRAPANAQKSRPRPTRGRQGGVQRRGAMCPRRHGGVPPSSTHRVAAAIFPKVHRARGLHPIGRELCKGEDRGGAANARRVARGIPARAGKPG